MIRCSDVSGQIPCDIVAIVRCYFVKVFPRIAKIQGISQFVARDPEFKAIVKEAQDEKAALRAQVREMEERGELDL